MVELQTYIDLVLSSIPAWFYWGLLVGVVIGGVVIYVNHNDNFNCSVMWKRDVARLMLLEWVALVVTSTVAFRVSSTERRIQLVPFRSYWDFGEHSYFQECFAMNVLNVALLVPVGFLAGCGLRGMTLKKVLLLGGVISVFIELLQFLFKKGFCETDDVIHNVLGCLIGYGLSKVIFNIEKYENKSYRTV